MRIFALSLALSSICLAGAAGAEPKLETLAAALSTIDALPTKAQLLALGASEDGNELLELARDEQRSAYTRMRAISFLPWFDSPQVRAGLVQILEDETTPVLELRVQALRSIATLEGAEARPRLERYLRGPSEQLRLAAERSLRSPQSQPPN